MNRRSSFLLIVASGACGLMGAFVSAPTASAAEALAVVLDEHGHRVFVNASQPAKGRGWFSGSGAARLLAPASEINQLVERTAQRFAVDPQLVHAIIQVESEYNPHAVSRKGALGLMQLLPSTASLLGVRNAFDPKQNIEGGVIHLKNLLEHFGGDIPLSLAAYNSGARTVERSGGIPSIPETKQYVRKVWNLYQPGTSLAPAKWGSPPASPIYRYVDTQGVVHFTNVE
jgi:hypothetical protein